MSATDSPWIKIVSLDRPSLQDNTADVDRLISGVKAKIQSDAIAVENAADGKVPLYFYEK